MLGMRRYLDTNVKVKKGQPFIVNTSNDYVIPIVNEGMDGVDNLYVVCTTHIGGWYGVYAMNKSEALDAFADYCAELVPDPEIPGEEKYRYPGLIQNWDEALDESGEFTDYFGPVGNEGWYFTELGMSPIIVEIK